LQRHRVGLELIKMASDGFADLPPTGPLAATARNGRVRIHDVARRCGLSITTVSQALNLRADQCRVSQQTRIIVQRAADELGYRPSRMARGLAKGQSFTVGILAWSVAPGGIYSEVISVLSETLATRGYHPILAPVNDRVEAWVQTMLDEQVDGCVVLNNVKTPLRIALSGARLPVVMVNVESDLPAPQILIDDVLGMRTLVEYLLSLGHRRIDFFNSGTEDLKVPPKDRHYGLRQREQSYRDTLTASGGTPRVVEIDCEGYVAQLVAMPPQERPTAVICFWHRLAMRLMRMLWERGLRVPEDISVATFNDPPEMLDFIPPITTVALPEREIGKRAATVLLDRLSGSGEQLPPGHREYLPPKLIARGSTAVPPTT